MALLSSSITGEVAIRLLLSASGSKNLARLACGVGGLAFPVYSSFKAIELRNTLEQKHWLLYWTAYGCFNAVENILDKLLSWLPGYYHAKLMLLIWLQSPLSNGACHLLTWYLRPPMIKYQAVLDGVVNGAHSDASKFFVAYLRELKFIKAAIHKLVQHGNIYQSLGSPVEHISDSGADSFDSVCDVPIHEESTSCVATGTDEGRL